ncbi:MAG: hypothetical protein HYU87_07410, partial [Chloroflexi bacterium]|nr:hypothetical protein [Chloroflexota bacterium]
MALKGDLAEFTVGHVLRLLENSGQSGTLDVRDELIVVTPSVTSAATVYAMRAVGSRIPLRGDEIDIDAIRRGDVAPARTLPFLAL